jgi:acetyl esterase/lipase
MPTPSRIFETDRLLLDTRIRELGAVIDPPRVKAWYAPYAEQQDTSGVDVRRDVAYGTDERHQLDVYTPSRGSDTKRAALIFVHGGGFIRGDKRDRANFGWYFARRNVVTILPNYRLGPKGTWPAGALDVAAVWAWVHANADSLGIDPARISLGGESAGAAHVAAATLIHAMHSDALPPPASVALISGVYNVELERRCREQFGVSTPDPRNDAYFGTDASRMRAMSTVRLVDVAPFPLLVTYAELDPPQMQVQAGELFARLVCDHGFAPQIKCIAHHNHLSQVEAVNTVDDTVAELILQHMT